MSNYAKSNARRRDFLGVRDSDEMARSLLKNVDELA